MTADHLERELREQFERLQPGPEAEARMAAAVEIAMGPPQPPKRRRISRPLIFAVAAAVFLAGASAGAYGLLSTQGPSVLGTAGSVGTGGSPVISEMPWLRQGSASGRRIGDAPTLPSLRFAPGTTYAEAIEAVLRSVVETGELPATGELADPLELGVVWEENPAGPRLDLRAPFGYVSESGLVRTPTFRVPGSTEPATAERIYRALAEGTPLGDLGSTRIRVDVPRLPPCQRRGVGPPPPCPAVPTD